MMINSVNNLSSLQSARNDSIVVSPLTLKELKKAVDKIYEDPFLREHTLFFNNGRLVNIDPRLEIMLHNVIPLGVGALKTALEQLVKDLPARIYQKPSFKEFTPLNNPPVVNIKLPSMMCYPPINYIVWQKTGEPVGPHIPE